MKDKNKDDSEGDRDEGNTRAMSHPETASTSKGADLKEPAESREPGSQKRKIQEDVDDAVSPASGTSNAGGAEVCRALRLCMGTPPWSLSQIWGQLFSGVASRDGTGRE